MPIVGHIELIAERASQFDAALPFVSAPSPSEIEPIKSVLAEYQAIISPLFQLTSTDEKLQTQSSGADEFLDKSLYYAVDTPSPDVESLAARLAEVPGVAAAYVMPEPELPIYSIPEPLATVDIAAVRSKTMSYRSLQQYLEPAPDGIHAVAAWSLPGGRGRDVNIIDIEQSWNLAHEDLVGRQRGVLGGIHRGDGQHGTAVMAMLCADDNGFGIVGVAPDSKVNAVSWHGWRPVTPLMINSLAASIDFAASHLRAGDILILEVHVPGPRHDFEIQKDPDGTPNQRGYIPVEWFPATAAAIKRATLRNIIVVSAAGNGYENLSDTIYDQRPRKFSFPSWWENPFRRRQRDTGSILVGAGAPPSDAYGPDRSRLEFSNYGSCVDCQGWGRQVVTAGYGALQGGPRERWYTGVFDGTSSATPLVAGAIACLQGAIKARGRQMQPPREIYLTPSRARELLRTTGSPQTSAPTSPATNRIGPRPNLKELLRAEGVS